MFFDALDFFSINRVLFFSPVALTAGAIIIIMAIALVTRWVVWFYGALLF